MLKITKKERRRMFFITVGIVLASSLLMFVLVRRRLPDPEHLRPFDSKSILEGIPEGSILKYGDSPN